MKHESPFGRGAEALEHLWQHWENRRKHRMEGPDRPLHPRGLTIALCREAGTDGTAIAREVGKRLGWPVYDHELLERIAGDMGLQTRLLETVDERRMDWLSEAFQDLMSVPHAYEVTYFHGLVRTVLALGSEGECVIVGRGAAFILPGENTLRVHLVAPLAQRLERIRRRRDLSPRDAKRELERLDAEQSAFIRDHFGRDPGDPRNYDVIVNEARRGMDGCADLIVLASQALQRRASRETRSASSADPAVAANRR